MKLLVQNLNPFYRELKTGRARVMDLLFCLIPRGRPELLTDLIQ